MEAGGEQIAKILLVDDNPGDVRLVEETFKDGQFHNDLYAVTDGEAAQDFIHQEGEYEDAPRPDIVLLAFYLPKVDSEDLLHEIKHHSELSNVLVIILTGTDDNYIESKDLNHDADEDAVLQKPLDTNEFLDVIRGFDGLNISIVKTEV